MKGILGLGATSTAYYLDQIHQKYNLNNKEFSTCPLLMYQIDFQQINPFLPDQFSLLIPKLQNYLSAVIKLGITKLLIPNITLHEAVEQIDISINICHPVTSTLKYLKEEQISSAAVFGTRYTMNSSYLKEKFKAENIALFIPSENEQNQIDNFRTKVYLKAESNEDTTEFKNLIKKYSKSTPVIIACTELSKYSIKGNPYCIDMANLQIDAFLS